MKKRIRNILLIVAAVSIALVFYGRQHFEKDKQSLLELKTKAANGEINYVLNKMSEINKFSNPLINLAYQRWKKKIYSRFILNDEVIENTSDNKVVNDISNIYREYWRTEILKDNPENRTDTSLYNTLSNYLISNKLTKIAKDSLDKIIKNDSETKRIIESFGFKTSFKYRNGFQELFIWDNETSKDYTVVLPKDTVNTTVIFIYHNRHLNGYDYYASFGSTSVGGWAIKERATLYCNDRYDFDSEKYKVSYLKHESQHFVDLNEYPNLSSADLEYRAKIIELMYCSEKTIYDRMLQFLSGADASNRNHSHPYANYVLIKNLSQLVFKSKYESDFSRWQDISVETINQAASSLFNRNEELLEKDKEISEII